MVILSPCASHKGLAEICRTLHGLPLLKPRRVDELHVTLRAVNQNIHDESWKENMSAALNALEWEIAVIRDDDPSEKQRTTVCRQAQILSHLCDLEVLVGVCVPIDRRAHIRERFVVHEKR